MNLEDMNYWGDRRVIAALYDKPELSADRKSMKVSISYNGTGEMEGHVIDEDIWVPIRFIVCPLCEGRGSHMDPSIDAGGLTQEDFERDPGFAEDYHSGAYLQKCNQCKGERVVPVPWLAVMDSETAKRVKEHTDMKLELARELARERRYGY